MLVDLKSEFGNLPRGEVYRRFAVYIGWLVFFVAAGHVIGLLPAMFVFMVLFMRYGGGASWRLTIAVALPLAAMWYGIFHRLLHLTWRPR